MAVHVHIDRLVLTAELSRSQAARLPGELESEVRRVFATSPAPSRSRLERRVSVPAVPAAATGPAGPPLARAIATAVHHAATGTS
jgi:hypothetical protein